MDIKKEKEEVGPIVPPMHYLDLTLAGIPANLALDEALLIEAEERGSPPVLRIWEPDAFAVVLGSSCRWREDVRVDACREDGVALARRSSGGGTVVVGPGTLNLTVVLPIDAAPGLGAVDVAHRFVLDRLARALREGGTAVEVRGLGDLTVGDRKFSGSAQRRLRRHFLVHATMLYDFPLEKIDRYTTLPRRQPSYRADRPHGDFLMNLGLPRASLIEAIRSAWIPPGGGIETPAVPEETVRELVASKFADPSWIQRL